MKKYLPLLVLLLLPTAILNAQVYGPEHEPPGGLFEEISGTEGDNLIGTASGKDFTYSSINLLNYTSVYYGTVLDSIKLSLDGGDFTSGDTTVMEVMEFSPELSDLAGGILAWTGITEIPDQSGVPVYTRFYLIFTDSEDAPLALTDAATLGLDPYLGGVPNLEAGMSFNVNAQFLASWQVDAGFQPHIPFYDANSVTDGLAFSSFGWGWYWENSAPMIGGNRGFKVDEGDTVIINEPYLTLSDYESDSTGIYLVMATTLPAHGTLYKEDLMLEEGDVFSVEDLQTDVISYIHDGSESTEDSIAVRIYDMDGKYYSETEDSLVYIPLTIVPVDDSPIVQHNEVITVNEGEEIVIDSTFLLTSDAESGAADVTYTFDYEGDNEYPENGVFMLNGVPLGIGDTFTQEDVNMERLSYKHNGSESLTDGMIFVVEDENGHFATYEASTSILFFFEVSIVLTNDNPVFTRNVPSEMTEWYELTIDSDHLAASDEESANTEIYFTLVPENQLPFYGHLQVAGVQIGPGESFTMQQILDGEVKYIETKNADEPMDKFVFRITDGDGGMAKDGEFTDFQHIINITQTGSRLHEAPVRVYPNPGYIFRIEGLDASAYKVYSSTGRLVKDVQLQGDLQEIDLSEQKAGVYMLKVYRDKELIYSTKLIRE